MWSIDLSANSSLPKVQQIQRALRQTIERGDVHTGARLPGMRVLAGQWGVSVGIAKQAITSLVAEGYLTASPRRGVFVARNEPQLKDIVLALPMIENEVLLKFATGLRNALRGTRRRLIVQAAAADYLDEIHLIDYLHPSLVHGVVIWPPPSRRFLGRLKELERLNIPTVQIAFGLGGLQLDEVLVDGLELGRAAADLLLQRGHRKIGFVDVNSDAQTQEEIRTGIQMAIRNFGNDSVRLERVECSGEELDPDRPWLNGENATNGLLRKHKHLTAVIGTNTHISIGCHRGIRASGKPVGTPDGISLVSMFGDLSVFEMLDPPVTTFDLPTDALCQRAVQQLLLRADSDKPLPPTRVCLSPRLIERQTVATLV